jgi:isochorismate synthase EntC
LGYAGGGITAKSDPVGEWAETEQKLQTLENVLLG